MRTLIGDGTSWEGRVFPEFAETILRPRSGDGIIPQVIKNAHDNINMGRRAGT